MNNAEYEVFEAKFSGPARELLGKIRDRLVEMGCGPFSEIEGTDHDVDRGLEFRDVSDPSTYVELRLADGDSHGFEGVGLIMDCSNYACGQVWAPGNYTDDVGIKDPGEVVTRIEACPVEEVADLIHEEWDRIKIAERLRDKHPGAGPGLRAS